MLFSSNFFLFVFLPFVILVYYAVLRKSRVLQNLFLFVTSLFFYAWGEPYFVLIMMVSITINWIIGLLISYYLKIDSANRAKIFLGIGVVVNLIIIFIFKYLNFTVININKVFHTNLTNPEIGLPIGISFFTFQAISYIVDVYRGNGEAQKNILNVGLYISFFPQLIAGPIVRYETVADQINNRKESVDDFCCGVYRFTIGFCKKILLANNLAFVADTAFDLSKEMSISIGMAWLGVVAYSLQIFYDFSGYSDMAIGLGQMFGFHFLENFNHPYISRTITEFWRRWHISLGTWFRDYVYIPLGGSRCSNFRNTVNLFVVWTCTGIWHGANWTFVLWGIMYFLLLGFERYTRLNKEGKNIVLGRIYTLFFVIMGWVLFRADNLSDAITYYRACFGANSNSLVDDVFIEFLRQYSVYMVIGVIFAIPIMPWIKNFLGKSKVTGVLYGLMLTALFIVAISFLVKGSYNPFIYFNF